MESTNRITDDTMESVKYGLQMTQAENGRLKADRPPVQVTIYHLKWARSALRDLWHSVWGSRCVIKHEAKPSALSRNETPTPRAINRVKHS